MIVIIVTLANIGVRKLDKSKSRFTNGLSKQSLHTDTNQLTFLPTTGGCKKKKRHVKCLSLRLHPLKTLPDPLYNHKGCFSLIEYS